MIRAQSSKLSRAFRTERDISLAKSELYLRWQNALIHSSKDRSPILSENIALSSSASGSR